jgi:hypothetical protein
MKNEVRSMYKNTQEQQRFRVVEKASVCMSLTEKDLRRVRVR